MNNFSTLPDEMIEEIMSHMDANNLMLFSVSNHRIDTLCNNFLKRFIHENYGIYEDCDKKLLLKCHYLTVLKNKLQLNISIHDYYYLNELNLHAMQLHELPIEIGFLKLKSLNLFYNCLTSIPKEIKQLKLLERLDLSHNWLKEIPEEIGLLFNLTYLTVSDNCLKEIPNLNQLSNLKFLNLACNQITSIDINIIQLKELYINNNQLTHVNFNALTELKYLNLYNNPIINFTHGNPDLLLVI